MATLSYNFHALLLNSLISKPHTSSFTFPLHQSRFFLPATRISTAISTPLRMASSASGQNPVVQQQTLVIPNKHGEKLVGLLHDTGSKELVILCHGFRSTKNHDTMVNLAAALEKEGISSFRFDFSGNGESEGLFEYGNYSREADDLHAVIQHFCGTNHGVSAILGHSKGGDVVLLYASRYQDVKMVINVSGRYDLKSGIAERFGKDFMDKVKKDGFVDISTGNGGYRVTEASLMERLNTDMHEACLKISKECRVLTVHGSDDEVIPVQDALEFAKIIPNHKLHVVDGANHGYTSHQTELASVVMSFIKSGIQKQ